MRVGPPELSEGKKFWPVQKAIYNVIPTWGEIGARQEFSHWEIVDYYKTKKEAEEALMRLTK